MTIRISSLSTPVRFEGTGENGKPRVIVAKTPRTMRSLNGLEKRPDIQIVGYATNDIELERLLIEKKPDVLVAGTIVAGSRTPLEVLKQFVEKCTKAGESITPPGFVLHSIDPPSGKIAWQKSAYVKSLGVLAGNLELDPVIQNPYIQSIVNAIQKVDPFPVQDR